MQTDHHRTTHSCPTCQSALWYDQDNGIYWCDKCSCSVHATPHLDEYVFIHCVTCGAATMRTRERKPLDELCIPCLVKVARESDNWAAKLAATEREDGR